MILLDEKGIERSLVRIAHEILEKNKGAKDIVLAGVLVKGLPVATRIAKNIEKIEGQSVQVVALDITHFRDDNSSNKADEGTLGMIEGASSDNIKKNNHSGIDCFSAKPFDDKIVILCDDVIYTGRTIRAAMDAVMSEGRARAIQLAVLIDRGHRELPIRPDFVGKNVPTSRKETIRVRMSEMDEINEVVLIG